MNCYKENTHLTTTQSEKYNTASNAEAPYAPLESQLASHSTKGLCLMTNHNFQKKFPHPSMPENFNLFAD